MTLRHGQVSFRAQQAVADTPADADVLPDLLPVVGYVDFVPTRTSNFDKGTGNLIYIQPVTAGIDAVGVMRDGQGNQTVTLVSPLSPDLLHQDWLWTARFRVQGATISPVQFALAVGQIKNLADESKLMSLVVEAIRTILVVNGDGTASMSGETVTDPGDGTFTVNDTALVDNGDGTYSLTA